MLELDNTAVEDRLLSGLDLAYDNYLQKWSYICDNNYEICQHTYTIQSLKKY